MINSEFSPTFVVGNAALSLFSNGGRKVRAAQGNVLPNGKDFRATGRTDSATENRLPHSDLSERGKGEKVR